MTTQQPQAENGGLKRLQPVLQAAEKGAQTAGAIYSATKERLPQSVKPRVEQLESSLSAAAAEPLHKAQDTGAQLLRSADERVDRALESASSTYARNATFLQEQLQRQKEFHAQNLEAYKQSREIYLKKVEDAVEYMKQKGLSGAARAAADEVLARVREAKSAVLAAPAFVVHKVQDAVDGLLAFGPVSSVVEAAKPRLEAAKGQYMRVHDQVVASQRYRDTFQLAADVAQRAQQTWLYSKARATLPGPLVETATPYINSLVAHLQPIEA